MAFNEYGEIIPDNSGSSRNRTPTPRRQPQNDFSGWWIVFAIILIFIGYQVISSWNSKKSTANPVETTQTTSPETTTQEQQTQQAAEDNSIYSYVQNSPQYPGGESALNEYLRINLSYPSSAKANRTSGKVYTSFIVNKDGSISNAEITQDLGNGCGEEALRLINNMPNWSAGYQNGEYKRVKVNLPITFKLPDPTYQTCGVCSGNGTVYQNSTCSSCSGYGYTNCSYCSGKGKGSCYYCSGKGSVSCNYCSGKGSISCNYCNGYGYTNCGSCSGKGYYSCNSCNGYGYLLCSTCNGKGKLLDQYNRLISCYSCSGYGKFQCQNCSGYKNIQCNSCRGQKTYSCRNCSGKGSKYCNTCSGNGSKYCNSCGGTGGAKCRYCSGNGHQTCNKCNGNKTVQERHQCSNCNGSGQVEVYQ